MSKAVFLDRDGVLMRLVLNHATGDYESPKSVEDVALLPQAAQSLQELQAAGYGLFLVSNQPDYAKGKTTLEMLDSIHAKFHSLLASQGIRFTEYYYCRHHPQGVAPRYSYACECRKPKPFFLLKAKEEHSIDLRNSWIIGDQDTDVECGKAAGTETILIETTESAETRGAIQPDYRVRNLLEATDIIFNNRK